ncbi:substrate-binding domain-containing protein [Paeniglutamicibacter sp. Y32M11]|uniref:substrate-binding domain-containing protein n=1 Tax=Paeniglutamicibacter sp. Y32M11 TaxID=2853258 RepID=UPI001C529529|nr:substrate-binding domain-containing protein [Paeniglutamicibacter sp. Y32M11]QXQ10290.1 substrate-binding domain-containing protein [Paeniglutamicibacter sp. Y32M11]
MTSTHSRGRSTALRRTAGNQRWSPLTSVRQPAVEIGRTAVEVLLREAGSGAVREQFVFAPKLVQRASSAINPAMHRPD